MACYASSLVSGPAHVQGPLQARSLKHLVVSFRTGIQLAEQHCLKLQVMQRSSTGTKLPHTAA